MTAVGQHARHHRDRAARVEADLHPLVENARIVHVIDDPEATLQAPGLGRDQDAERAADAVPGAIA